MDTTIYTKEEIVAELHRAYIACTTYISEQDESNFNTSVDGKWSTAQQLEHLRKSSKPLAMILGKPKFIMRLVVGKPNRASRSCKEVIAKYEQKLSDTYVPPNRFNPTTQRATKSIVLNNYLKVSEKLERNINGFVESDLDNYILPHPLLGKLTVREMMFFTIFHTWHHLKSIQNYYPA